MSTTRAGLAANSGLVVRAWGYTAKPALVSLARGLVENRQKIKKECWGWHRTTPRHNI
jgi:hypothetical protein